MIKLYKLLFFTTLMISTLISISAQSWLGMWIGLEINLLSIIPLMNNSKNSMNTEASIKYFITQALASTILLLSMILMAYNLTINPITTLIFDSSLFIKMGAAPFHFWFPEVMEGLNWSTALILLTWQKITPMIMIMYNINLYFTIFIIINSMLISGIMGLNQTSLRKILAYSSINHIGWMMSSLMFMETIWLYYFIVYLIMTFNIILIFKMLNVFYLKQLFMILKQNFWMKMIFILNFMSLGGLPPFIGFFPKWVTVQLLILNNSYLLSLLMIMLTLLTLFFYMRITFNTILLSSNELKIFTKLNYSMFLILTTNIINLMGLIMSTIFFNLI